MFNSWKKIKKSGSYHRSVNKIREQILHRAHQISEEIGKNNTSSARPLHLIQRNIILNETIVNNIVQHSTSTSANCNIHHAICREEENEEQSEFMKNAKLRDDLKKWASEHQITHAALNNLMNIINIRIGKIFPEDCRTLLKTPQEVSIMTIGSEGQYWHHGFEQSLQYIFHNLSEPKTISININIDGLPLFNSSKMEFWPILFNINEMPHVRPNIIGIYCGTSKCDDIVKFLTPFVNEMKDAMSNGIIINNQKITIEIRAIICDSPARAYVKGT